MESEEAANEPTMDEAGKILTYYLDQLATLIDYSTRSAPLCGHSWLVGRPASPVHAIGSTSFLHYRQRRLRIHPAK